MKKIVCIPDSFKGTLSSLSVCEVMKTVIEHRLPSCEVVTIPIADGGEGSVDAFLSAIGGEKIKVEVLNPYFEPMQSFYGRCGNEVAIIEMAAAAGLPLVYNRANPSLTTTYGVGQLIAHAIDHGAKNIIVGLGGSCTNDGGCGAAAALGVKFFNKQEEVFTPVGATLIDIARIDTTLAMQRLNGITITTMCDIDNPMFGLQGAAYIFAPQKGADMSMVQHLDEGLRHLATMMEQWCGIDVSLLPGSAAAGGMGAGMVAFCNSTLQMGIETILNTVNFESVVKDADCIFTGEGKIDAQSLRGKVVIGVGRRAKLCHVPVIAIVGAIGEDISEVYNHGITAVFSINPVPEDFEIAKHKTQSNLALTVDNVVRTLMI